MRLTLIFLFALFYANVNAQSIDTIYTNLSHTASNDILVEQDTFYFEYNTNNELLSVIHLKSNNVIGEGDLAIIDKNYQVIEMIAYDDIFDIYKTECGCYINGGLKVIDMFVGICDSYDIIFYNDRFYYK